VSDYTPTAPKPWHQRTPYAGVKTDPSEIVVQNGRVTQGVNRTYTREAFEELRVGRRCIMCDEPQIKEAFPKECSLCRFPMKNEQLNYLAKMDQGEEHVGTTINFSEELDRMDDEIERDKWAEHPTSGIIVPR
jgi:hypothetical protein